MVSRKLQRNMRNCKSIYFFDFSLVYNSFFENSAIVTLEVTFLEWKPTIRFEIRCNKMIKRKKRDTDVSEEAVSCQIEVQNFASAIMLLCSRKQLKHG